jgi:anti-sigma regulatory factor (Ser/Thr protein kinase)
MPEVRLTSEAVTAGGVENTLRLLESATSIVLEDSWLPSSDSGLIAGALIGKLRDRHLIIQAATPEAIDGALRFGLATALARRDRRHTQFDASAEPLAREGLARLWTTGTRAITEAMFQATDQPPVDAIGAMHATFVNAHLASSAKGHYDVVFLVRRWLVRRLRHQLGADVKVLSERIAEALIELIANVQEHAGQPDRDPVDSLLRVAIDDQYVRCSVIDNGRGIAATLEPKLDLHETPEVLLRRLLDNDLPSWHGGRGVGLPRVADVVRGGGGTLHLASGPLRAYVSEGQGTSTVDGRADVGGVVADATFPIRA